MFKFLCVLPFLINSMAFADPLDSALARQSQFAISPVQHDGLPLTTGGGQGSGVDDNTSAGYICGVLGYPRLVSFKAHYLTCTGAAPVSSLSKTGIYSDGAFVFNQASVNCGYTDSAVLDEVVCAK